MTSPVHDYAELIAALRDAKDERGLSDRVLADVAGLSRGLVGRVMAGTKPLGMVSLGALLSALGKSIVLVDDAESLARFAGEYEPRNETRVRKRSALSTHRKAKLEAIFCDPGYFKKLGRKGGKRAAGKLTANQRSARARNAVNARWRTIREIEKRAKKIKRVIEETTDISKDGGHNE